MSYTTPGLFGGDETAVDAAFEAAGLGRATFEFWPKPGPPTPLRSFRSQESVFTVAIAAAGRDQILLETSCRDWAVRQGIGVPRVRRSDAGGGWMLADYVTVSEPEGSPYVSAALDIADRISAGPPPLLPRPASEWSGNRRDALRRSIRVAVGGLPPLRYRRARAAAAALEDRCLNHGDFYRRNVLHAGSGEVLVVDWEFIGPAPRFTDHLRLWSTLRRPQDRDEAWQRITTGLSRGRRQHVAVLAEYLVLRLLGENLAAPSEERNPDDLAHARSLVRALPAHLTELT